jgi:hypothetical protein
LAGVRTEGLLAWSTCSEVPLLLSAEQWAWRPFRVLLCTNYVAFGRVAGGTGRVGLSEWRRRIPGWRCSPTGCVCRRETVQRREGSSVISPVRRGQSAWKGRPRSYERTATSRAATQTPTSLGRAASRATAPQPQHQHRVHDCRKMASEAPQPVEAGIQDAPPPEVSADAAQKPPVKRSWR